MNVLIVLAHPEPHSFNAHLVEQARQAGWRRGTGEDGRSVSGGI